MTGARTSGFLQKINENFFQPRGLYCLVMTWKPESSHRVDRVDLRTTIASHGQPNTGFSGFQNRFRSSDGRTHGDLEFPEVAPLVFPSLDRLAAQGGAEGAKKKGKMAESMGFVADYWDKRAAARYVGLSVFADGALKPYCTNPSANHLPFLVQAGEHPHSTLAQVPPEQFSSRYADPNHPASSGSLISFVSGGRLNPGPESRGLIGGVASAIGQAVRRAPPGSEWNKVTTHRDQSYDFASGDRYGRGYQGRGRRGGQHRPSYPREGPILTPVRAYKKLLKKVRLHAFYLLCVVMDDGVEKSIQKGQH